MVSPFDEMGQSDEALEAGKYVSIGPFKQAKLGFYVRDSITTLKRCLEVPNNKVLIWLLLTQIEAIIALE